MTPRLLAAAALAAAIFAAPVAASAANTDPAAMPAGTYVNEKTHSFLTAKLSHVGLSTYQLRFNDFDVTYTYDPKAPAASKINASVKLDSLDTGNSVADKEFPKFMGADKTPVATFVSTAIKHSGNKGTVTGDLTLNGVTKPVTLNLTFNGYGPAGPAGNKSGFSGSGTFKRSDFGLTTLLPMIGDEITLEIEAEFGQKK